MRKLYSLYSCPLVQNPNNYCYLVPNDGYLNKRAILLIVLQRLFTAWQEENLHIINREAREIMYLVTSVRPSVCPSVRLRTL